MNHQQLLFSSNDILYIFILKININLHIFYRARPVIAMSAEISFLDDFISQEKKTCPLNYNGTHTMVACTFVTYCFKYGGENVDRNVEIQVHITLDTKKPRNPRVFFVDDPINNKKLKFYNIEWKKPSCDRVRVYLINEDEEHKIDKLTPIETEMTYSIRNRRDTERVGPRYVQGPILDQNIGTQRKASMNIMKNCGEDQICIPNLELRVDTIDEFKLGDLKPFDMNVTVANLGEDAFEAEFYLNVPQGLQISKVEQIDGVKDVGFRHNVTNGGRILKCEIGNPLPKDRFIRFQIIFNVNPAKEFGTAKLILKMEVNSSNAEMKENLGNNLLIREIPIGLQAEVVIYGLVKCFYKYN